MFLSSILLVPLFAAALAMADPYFAPPPGWVAQQPSQEMMDIGMVAIWQPAKPNGENIALSIYSREGAESLKDEESDLIREEKADARHLVSTRRHATCHGKQDGVDVNMRFGSFVYQFYHLAVKGRRVYSLVYTHSFKDRTINASVLRAIDSFCPP